MARYSEHGVEIGSPTILEEAGSLVDGPREATYGHPADDFGNVARAAHALGIDPQGQVDRAFNDPALHHALYMILVKIQRLVQTPDHRDSIVDIAGYARTYEKVLERNESQEVEQEEQVKRYYRSGYCDDRTSY